MISNKSLSHQKISQQYLCTGSGVEIKPCQGQAALQPLPCSSREHAFSCETSPRVLIVPAAGSGHHAQSTPGPDTALINTGAHVN